MPTNALNRGEVEIVLDGKPHILKPTLQAFQNIATAAGYRDLLHKVERCEVGAIAFIILQGLGMKNDEAPKLSEAIFKTGIVKLAGPVSEYLFRLFNGGKSPDEILAEAEAEEAGNGLAAG